MVNPFVFNEPLSPRIHGGILGRSATMERLCGHIDKGDYCLLLGPQFSGRTTILRALCDRRNYGTGHASIYVRSHELNVTGEARFFASLARVIESSIRQFGDGVWPEDMTGHADEICKAADRFNSYLEQLLRELPICVVLMIDGIERIPPNILTRLANIMHAFYSQRAEREDYKKLCVIFAGSVSLRHLTYHEHPELSPFNVCKEIVLSDLSLDEARRYIEAICSRYQLRFREDAITAIVDYAGGDINMLQHVASLALAKTRRGQDIDRAVVTDVVHVLIGAGGDKPDEFLRHSSMLVEESYSTLELVLSVLDSGNSPYRPSLEDDQLYNAFKVTYPEMTGALFLDRPDGTPDSWRFRNRLMEMYFRKYFTPQRIVRAYAALGRFDRASDRCQALLENVKRDYERNIFEFDDNDLKDVLIVFTNCIYANGAYESAFQFIAQLIRSGFGFSQATYFDYVKPQKTLRAVEFLSHLFANDGRTIAVEDTNCRDELEVRALDTKLYAIEAVDNDSAKIAIPLQNLVGDVTGVITLSTSTKSDGWATINLRVQVIQRALHVINLALNRVESENKNKIEDSLKMIRSREQTVKIFVAHKFSSELLTNLRDHLGRVSELFHFVFADKEHGVGLLSKVIENEMKSAGLCLYEVSHPNNNVYFEIGIGLGLNRPGLMFCRETKAQQAQLPPLLQGVSRIGYIDYNSLLRDLSGTVEDTLKQYLLHQKRGDFLHFAGVHAPSMTRVRKYAVVLDNEHFGDQGDYRSAVRKVLAAHDLAAVFPLDGDHVVHDVLEGSDGVVGSLPRIVNWYNLIRNADVVIGRIEQTDDDAVAGQVFIGLGIAFGLNRRRMFLTCLTHDFRSKDVSEPADLRGISKLAYGSIVELEKGLEQVVNAGLGNGKQG